MALAIVAIVGLSQAIASKRMADGKTWTTQNLRVVAPDSYCYGDKGQNCDRYGRLYTWGAAQRACGSLGAGWRLPTNEEWQRLARNFGGVAGDSDDGGKGAYKALISGGTTGFDALKAGGRTTTGEYAHLDAHGFFWTASESDAAHAWFYNFGGQEYLNRHSDGEKERAFSVRCVKE